jgi:hypothetical protein
VTMHHKSSAQNMRTHCVRMFCADGSTMHCMYKNELRWVLEPQAKATAYLYAKFDQERPQFSWCSMSV